MARIVNLQVVFQSQVSRSARKSVIRRYNADGPYRNRTVDIAVDYDAGPGSGANVAIRHIIADTLKKQTHAGELLFYVIATFEHARGQTELSRYFKTIVPRSEIPLSFRRVRH